MTVDTVQIPKTHQRESDLTPDDIVQRAVDLRGLLREEAAEGERLGRYTEKVHDAFLEAGLYHVLAPRRFNGYEFDVRTYMRIVMALAAGDAAVAWNYALGHGHVLTTAAFWPEEAQEAAFGNPLGYLKAGHSARPAGTATPTEGGYIVKGRSDYQSGISYGTHATVNVQIPADGDVPARMVNALIPLSDLEVLDNWGGDKVIGLSASGSNSVVFDTFVPAHSVITDQIAPDPSDDSAAPGLRLHGNAQYLATTNTFRTLGLQAIMAGAARGAVDEYERLLREKRSTYIPFAPRAEDPLYQVDFWTSLSKADAAERLVLCVTDEYQARVAEYVAGGRPFAMKEDIRLAASAFEAGQLGADAVQTVIGSAGSGEVQGKGKYLEKLYRDWAGWRTHSFTNRVGFSRTFAGFYLGNSDTLF